MDKILITRKVKDLIEKNPVALATVMPNNQPNVIGVAYVKVVDENHLLITDNYMNQTLDDIEHNPNVAIVVWDKAMNGYKLIGKCEYLTSGKWFEKVKSLPENKGMPVKGTVLVTVDRIIKSH